MFSTAFSILYISDFLFHFNNVINYNLYIENNDIQTFLNETPHIFYISHLKEVNHLYFFKIYKFNKIYYSYTAATSEWIWFSDYQMDYIFRLIYKDLDSRINLINQGYSSPFKNDLINFYNESKPLMDRYSKFDKNYFSEEEVYKAYIRCYKDSKRFKKSFDIDSELF